MVVTRRDVTIALGVAALFVTLTLVWMWPLPVQASTSYLDNRETMAHVWLLTTLKRNVVGNPLNLFEGSTAYPFSHTAAVLDYVIADAILAAVFLAPVSHPMLLYNIVFMGTYVLTGFFMYLLIRELTGSRTAGVVGGIAFAFLPYRIGHQSHLHVLSTQFWPLAFLALHKFIDRPTTKRAVLLTVAGVAVSLSSWHMAVMGAVGLAVVALCLMVGGSQFTRRRVVGLVACAAVSLAVLVPIALTYREVLTEWRPRAEGAGWSATATEPHVINLEGLLSPGNADALYAPLLPAVENESRAFPGIVITLLGAGAVVVLRRQRRVPAVPEFLRIGILVAAGLGVVLAVGSARNIVPVVQSLRPLSPFLILAIALLWMMAWRVYRCREGGRTELLIVTYAAVVLVAMLLGLGPRVTFMGAKLGLGIYQPSVFPLFAVIRTPSRFALLMGFGAAVLAGLTVAAAQRRWPRYLEAMPAALLVGILFLDLWWFSPVPLGPPPPQEAMYDWLRDYPEPGAVLEFPTKDNRHAIYGSLQHRRRLVNSLGITRPLAMRSLKEPADDFTVGQINRVLSDLHPRFIVVRTDLYDDKERPVILQRIESQADRLKRVGQFGPVLILELIDRTRAPVIERNWPFDRLVGKKGFQVEGSVPAGRPDTASRLNVSINGRQLFSMDGPAVERGFARFLPLEGLDLEPGVNEVRLRADYRLTGAPNPVGTTGGVAAADVEILARRSFSQIIINGRLIDGSKGYRLVVLDRAGDVAQIGTFNTSWYEEDSQKLVQFVDAIPAGSAVAIASEFDVSRNLSPAAVTALGKLGFSADLRSQEGAAHAGVGIKGAPPGTAVEAVNPRSIKVVLGQPGTREIQLTRFELQ